MHKPVLINEVIQYLSPKDGEVFIDATFGAGGYTREILSAAKCRVIGIDQDPSVKKFADKISADFPNSFELVEGNFSELEDLITEQVDGVVFDIGVSSMQFDEADRGFSFRFEGALDMRMSGKGMSAAEFLNSAKENEIADVIYKYGEERASRRIAKEIVNSRPLTTTKDLSEAVHRCLGKGGKIDTATKTFQAIRIYINNELVALHQGLAAALKLLKAGGRLVVVSFHSLEDRIVKMFFKEFSGHTESQNRHLFVGDSSHDFSTQKKNEKNSKSVLEIITKKAIMPSEEELMNNSRARSAKLRAATKMEVCYA